ncbi:hypothetical protein [Halpernia frigidisoli]|uniref:BioF2-like acetyltransferase domain-containing protein n=1 Tax=Halpernia frigidisoli TaxID=1125876 RepID=A0A1I3EEK0_9FLAO|nr:hypothetical protein [Halpernia frigidisoli]SFH97359.1 hypothetical protein SAMN05443292_1034 [Halpernia frigidisoli]
MIKILNYSEIDFKKYSECLIHSKQYKYSAEKVFLDITSHRRWDLLVLNDYESVMPIPFVKKWGFKFVINPKLCQQLGVFSIEDNREINDLFLEFLEKKYIIWYYAFNAKNVFSKPLATKKNYYIAPDNYENVRQNYSPKRKRKLRLDQEVLDNSFVSKEIDIKIALDFIEKSISKIIRSKDLRSFLSLFEQLHQNKGLEFYGFFFHKKLINLIAIEVSEKTVALLGTFNDPNFIKTGGSSILIDEVLKKYISTKAFDFEGSEISSVEEFFRGFRPELEHYPYLQNSKIEILRSKIFN